MSESAKKHKAAALKKLNFAVFVCSTSRYQRVQKGEKIEDISGDTIAILLRNAGHTVAFKKIISDDKVIIEGAVKSVLSSTELDVAIFCGGTGISPKDLTIDTVSPLLEKTLPGFGEIFRRLSYDKEGSAAVLSRALAGVAKGKAFFCIPGSPDAVRVSVEMLILPEAPHIVRHARE
ncbi:MAG: molybdenum cofactor biosynthesis protein MoaB [Candidatus Bathyarchaeota archaeon]|nr:MAG: molybdenum cofactor biosynthesis protein MoaB [Candidatus Bathyarchaeota archaeon]